MKINRFILLSIALIFTLSLDIFSQQNPKIKRSQFYQNENGFSTAWKNVKEADKYYQAGVGTYGVAIEKYWIAQEYNKSNAALNYKIGVCYLFTGKSKLKALEHLKTAHTLNPYIASDVLFLLGRAYHLNLDFENAKAQYNLYLESLDPSEKRKLKAEEKIKKLIEECENGAKITQYPTRVILKNLGSNINSTFDEYNPLFTPDYSEMYFTSRRDNTTKGRRVKMDNKFFEDLYYSKNVNGEWSPAQPLGKPFNTKHNDATAGISPDGKTIYVYNGDYKGGEVLSTEYKKGKWRNLDKMPSVFRSKFRETSLVFNQNSTEVYFISERKQNNIGGKDIYYAKKNAKGKWEEPQNLGVKLNTNYDEEGLYLSFTGDTLYFSSKGHNTMGGFDIFMTFKDLEGNWQDPINLGYPVNTPEDDIFYKTGEKPKQIYLTTVRDEGYGYKDIFQLTYLGSEKEMKFSNQDNPILWTAKPDSNLFYRIPEKLEIDTTLMMIGTVTDATSSKGIAGKLQLIDLDLSQIVATTISDDEGNYKLNIPNNKRNFGIEINAKGYLFFVNTVDLSMESFENDVAIRNFQLDKIEVGAKMILKNIYFDTGKATLKSESFPELARVVQLLKDNPDVKIEISGHTDNVGAASYNKKLSKDRAKSVVEYLIANGIEKGSMSYEGYGFDQPVSSNKTEDGRAQNRRVEFKIMSVNK